MKNITVELYIQMLGLWKLITRTLYVTMLSILDGLYQGSPPPNEKQRPLVEKERASFVNQLKNFFEIML